MYKYIMQSIRSRQKDKKRRTLHKKKGGKRNDCKLWGCYDD